MNLGSGRIYKWQVKWISVKTEAAKITFFEFTSQLRLEINMDLLDICRIVMKQIE